MRKLCMYKLCQKIIFKKNSKLNEDLFDKTQEGVSFLEILIVIVIMAGIAAIVGPALFGRLDDAKIDTTKIQMKSFSAALDHYHLDNSVFPSTEQGLEGLIERPVVGKIPNNWNGPYLKSSKVPKDPWKNDYFYQSLGDSFTMGSYGSDGEEGGEGSKADLIFE